MNKLLNAFKADQSEANRQRLIKYMIKHPFSVCLLMPEDQAFLEKHWILVA